MSLFRVRNWWSAQCSDIDGFYCPANFLCCRFGFEENEKDYIVTASHSGYLSIFYPSSELKSDVGEFTGYKSSDLVLEHKFDTAIRGIVAGSFRSSSKSGNSSSQLAVLHPLNLGIYNISHISGVADYGSQWSLVLITEYKLNKASYSICSGHFGGVKGKQFLCIMHIDGSLTFFEQDGITYCCILPGNISTPSYITYEPKSDSFLRVNSNWELESFSYQTLSGSVMNSSNYTPTWTLCIGEQPIAIAAVRITNTTSNIMILGERSLLSVSDEGNIHFIKKLDFTPVCFHTFVLGWYWEPNARLMTVIVSDSGRLLIYENANLTWAAQLEHIPLAISRSNLSSLPGGIVTLTANGTIHVGFLGSEPYLQNMPRVNLTGNSFQSAYDELMVLENEIPKRIDSTEIGTLRTDIGEHINIKTTVVEELNKCVYDVSEEIGSQTEMCLLIVDFRVNTHINQLQFTFHTAGSIKCSSKLVTYTDVAAGTFDQIKVWIYVVEKSQISSTLVEIIVSFVNVQNIPRLITNNCFLPLNLFYKIVPPVSESAVKLDIVLPSKSNQKYWKLSQLFGEIPNDIAADPHAVGLLNIYSGDVITVLTSKGNNKLRVQSNSFEAMSAILEILLHRIRNAAIPVEAKQEKEVVKTQTTKILPLFSSQDFIKRILYHYEIEQEIKEKTLYMDALWNQFKFFQRCLQRKSEGDPIDGLQMLIELNYNELITEGDSLLQLRSYEQKAKNNLSCAIAIIRHCVHYSNISKQIVDQLVPAFTYPVEDWTENCWEELSAPSIQSLAVQDFSQSMRDSFYKEQEQHSNFDFTLFERYMKALVDGILQLIAAPKVSNSKAFSEK